MKKKSNGMKIKWIIYPLDTGLYNWWPFGCSNQDCQEGTIEEMVSKVGKNPIAFIFPAPLVCLYKVSFSKSEKKHLHRSLPYTLEDGLATDVEELHFAFSIPENNELTVAVVSHELMDQLLGELNRYDFEVAAIWPEQLLIPETENGWTLWYHNNYCIVRYDKKAGFAIELDSLPLALKCLQEETESLTESIDLYCTERDKENLINSLPENLRLNANWRGEKSRFDLEYDGYLVDLLQGSYVKKVAWGELEQFWRWPLVLFLLVIGINFGYAISENIRLGKINNMLTEEVERVFRTAIPKGIMAEPELQLKRLIINNQVESEGDVLGFIYQFGGVLKDSPMITLKSASYSELKNEFHLYVLANAFTEVESFREALQDAGLQAELVGSSIENKKTLARLRVRRLL